MSAAPVTLDEPAAARLKVLIMRLADGETTAATIDVESEALGLADALLADRAQLLSSVAALEAERDEAREELAEYSTDIGYAVGYSAAKDVYAPRAERAEARCERAEEALRQAIQVIEWCGANDKTPTYAYGTGISAARSDGQLPGPGKAFNTPREFARYWPDVLREALAAAGAGEGTPA